MESSTPEKGEQSMQQNNTADDERDQALAEHESMKTDDTIDGTHHNENIEEIDDTNKDNDDASLPEEDDAILNEQLSNIARGDEEDFEFNCIIGHKWESGLLIFDVELTSGKNVDIPFHLLK